jgi:predicted DNA binding CopG/RHH family protein
MPLSEARKKANKKWNEEHPYDRISLFVKQGDKDKIKAHAETIGMSLNAYINDLIEKDMEK